MDPTDLLYTNKFTTTGVISNKELESDAINFIPFERIKREEVNDIRNEMEHRGIEGSEISNQKYKASGWNKGTLANQRPTLSDTVRDATSDTYFEYKDTFINIDSRLRDLTQYARPNNYGIYLNKQFENVVSIELVDYNFVNLIFPVNYRNNKLIWFTPTDRMLVELIGEPGSGSPLIIKNGTMYQWSYNFIPSNDPDAVKYSTYFREIPEGIYTTESLALKIREVFNTQLFFKGTVLDPSLAVAGSVVCQDGSDGDATAFPQLLEVDINPETHYVRFLLRREEIPIDYIQSYRGKNYIDVMLKLPVGYESQFDFLCNQVLFPLVPTYLPSVGGINEVLINWQEFLSVNYGNLTDGYNYYECVIDEGTSEIISGLFRLYIFNRNLQPICATTTEKIVLDECEPCSRGRIGRSQPFFFIFSSDSPEGLFTVQQQNILSQFLCNLDGSSKSVLTHLGWQQYIINQAVLSASQLPRGINTNFDFTSNLFTSTTTYLYKELTDLYKSMVKLPGGTSLNVDVFFDVPRFPEKLMNLVRDSDGKYYFYNDDYIFLKLITNTVITQDIGNNLIQATSNFSTFGGKEELYLNRYEEINGVLLKFTETVTTFGSGSTPSEIFGLGVPSILSGDESVTAEKLTLNKKQEIKDLNNLFAKIKLSQAPDSNGYNKVINTKTIFLNDTIDKLDELKIQFIDYEGKILDLHFNHSFTLKITEKVKKLKETNINTHTNSINTHLPRPN